MTAVYCFDETDITEQSRENDRAEQRRTCFEFVTKRIIYIKSEFIENNKNV